MGCDKYYLMNDESPVCFSEGDDTIGCLCTFPHNDGNTLDAERVRSLAYLGAAIVLMQHEDLEHGYLPECLPQWIRDEIDRHLLPNGGGQRPAADKKGTNGN